MPGYRLGQAAKMLGVSVDTVRRMVDDGRLAAVRTSGGQRMIDGESLAAIAKPKRKDRREEQVKQSARNRFPGIVTRVIKDRVAAQVEIQAGPHRLVSLLTQQAVRAQVGQGAEADVIASADAQHMTELSKKGLVDPSVPQVFAHNKLEIAVAPGNPKHIHGLQALSRSDLVVVLADPSVPAGKY